MFLLDWYQQYLMIRSQWRRDATDIVRTEKEVEICQSCETLRDQLALANAREQKLLDRIMEKPEKPVDTPHVAGKPILPLRTPWKVRQQMLETEDRIKAQRLREAPKPSTTDVAELEKELDIASAERTAEGTTKVD